MAFIVELTYLIEIGLFVWYLDKRLYRYVNAIWKRGVFYANLQAIYGEKA